LRWDLYDEAMPKTTPTTASVAAFLDAVPDVTRRSDARTVAGLMAAVSFCEPTMWGESIVGYGTFDNRNVPWPLIAFSPRKSHLVLYLNVEIEPELFTSLGQYRRGVGCLHIKRLADINMDALRLILARSLERSMAGSPKASRSTRPS
jgi:hypothetical protein